jgi:hypothetical protein
VLPIAVTALLPLIFFPLLGVMPATEVSINYFKDQVRLAHPVCHLARASGPPDVPLPPFAEHPVLWRFGDRGCARGGARPRAHRPVDAAHLRHASSPAAARLYAGHRLPLHVAQQHGVHRGAAMACRAARATHAPPLPRRVVFPRISPHPRTRPPRFIRTRLQRGKTGGRRADRGQRKPRTCGARGWCGSCQASCRPLLPRGRTRIALRTWSSAGPRHPPCRSNPKFPPLPTHFSPSAFAETQHMRTLPPNPHPTRSPLPPR